MKPLLLIFLLCFSAMLRAQNNFKSDQLKFERVKNAFEEKWPALERELKSKGFEKGSTMLINAYKTEGKLEIWLKKKSGTAYSLFKTYDFCAHSGTLGPKVFEGDGQTPEGFYHINVFNPMSTYYLSLGINYPNAVDLWRTGKDRKPGSDIYIHGNCVTIGCIPLTDDKIKEVYLLAVLARDAGQEDILVSIYPFRMTAGNQKKFIGQFPDQTSFWKSLTQSYTYFEKHRKMPNIKEEKGNYVIQ